MSAASHLHGPARDPIVLPSMDEVTPDWRMLRGPGVPGPDSPDPPPTHFSLLPGAPIGVPRKNSHLLQSLSLKPPLPPLFTWEPLSFEKRATPIAMKWNAYLASDGDDETEYDKVMLEKGSARTETMMNVCPTCDQVFTTRSDLLDHFSIHVGARAFESPHHTSTWDRYLQPASHLYRSTATPATGFSPLHPFLGQPCEPPLISACSPLPNRRLYNASPLLPPHLLSPPPEAFDVNGDPGLSALSDRQSPSPCSLPLSLPFLYHPFDDFHLGLSPPASELAAPTPTSFDPRSAASPVSPACFDSPQLLASAIPAKAPSASRCPPHSRLESPDPPLDVDVAHYTPLLLPVCGSVWEPAAGPCSCCEYGTP